MKWMFLELTLIFRLTWDIQVIITPSQHAAGHMNTTSDIFYWKHAYYWFCWIYRLTSLLSWIPKLWRLLRFWAWAEAGETKEGEDQWKLFQVAADIWDVEDGERSDSDTHLASVGLELELDNWERRGSSQFRSYSWFNDNLTVGCCYCCGGLRLATTAN